MFSSELKSELASTDLENTACFMRLFYDWSTQNVLANYAHVETIRLLNVAQLSWFDEEYPSTSSFKSRQRFSALWPVQHTNTIWFKLFHCGSDWMCLVVVLLECQPPPISFLNIQQGSQGLPCTFLHLSSYQLWLTLETSFPHRLLSPLCFIVYRRMLYSGWCAMLSFCHT